MEGLLFVPSVKGCEDLCGLFAGLSLAELPVAGRRLVDYGLEVGHKAGIDLVEILDWHASERLEKSFEDPTGAAGAVFCQRGEGDIPRGLDSLSSISSPLTQSMEDGMVVVWGPCLAHNLDGFNTEPVSAAECADTPLGIYRRQNGAWHRLVSDAFVIRSAGDLLDMNMTVLHEPGIFTLPGYSAEHGVHLGRSVVMEFGTEVKPPVLLNDNTWLARNVRLEGDVIVGAGTFIAEGSTLRRSVVCGNTYIGEGLVLDGKIVAGRRIIDAETDAWTDVEDDGIARSVRRRGSGLLSKFWQFIQGASKGR